MPSFTGAINHHSSPAVAPGDVIKLFEAIALTGLARLQRGLFEEYLFSRPIDHCQNRYDKAA